MAIPPILVQLNIGFGTGEFVFVEPSICGLIPYVDRLCQLLDRALKIGRCAVLQRVGELREGTMKALVIGTRYQNPINRNGSSDELSVLGVLATEVARPVKQFDRHRRRRAEDRCFELPFVYFWNVVGELACRQTQCFGACLTLNLALIHLSFEILERL